MKTEAHQRYQGENGEQYPGVTTVLGILDKPGLVKWANNLGLQGIDSFRFTSERGEIGTLLHDMVMCYFAGRKPDTLDYSANQIKQAEHSMALFHKWRITYNVRPLLIEKHLVSKTYCYGGTLDLYATLTIGGQDFNELIDFKTSAGFYPAHFAQIAAYRNLLIENGYAVENCRVVRLAPDPTIDAFAEAQILSLDKYWILFRHCLAIWKLKLL